MTRIWQWTSFAGMVSRPLSLPLSISPPRPRSVFFTWFSKDCFSFHSPNTHMELSCTQSSTRQPCLCSKASRLCYTPDWCFTVLAHTIAPLSLEWLHFFLLSAADSEVRSPSPLSLYPVSRLMDYSIRINLKTKQIKIMKISLLPSWNLGMVKLWKSASFCIICYVISDLAESWVPANRDI